MHLEITPGKGIMPDNRATLSFYIRYKNDAIVMRHTDKILVVSLPLLEQSESFACHHSRKPPIIWVARSWFHSVWRSRAGVDSVSPTICHKRFREESVDARGAASERDDFAFRDSTHPVRAHSKLLSLYNSKFKSMKSDGLGLGLGSEMTKS